MRSVIVFIFLVTTSFSYRLFSQPPGKSFPLPDRIALSAPDSFSSIPALTRYLVKDLDTETDRVRAIYTWILHNVEYDDHLGRQAINRSVRDKEKLRAGYVFENRRAICSGYALLLNEMCKQAGIACIDIGCYLSDHQHPQYRAGDVFLQPAHMANVVRVDGHWYHADLTFDREYLQMDEDSLRFLVEPREFMQTRLPDAPMFQLVKNPVSFEEFVNDSLFLTHDFNAGKYHFTDSIDFYMSQGLINRELYYARQTFIFNPMYSDAYAYALQNLGDSLYFQDGETLHDYYGNIEKARDVYYEVLKYLRPYRMLYMPDDKVYSVKSQIPRKYIHNLKKRIRYIERKHLG